MANLLYRPCVHNSCLAFQTNFVYSSIGPSNDGAGSGGRIAVYLSERFVFRGVLNALGGSSVDAYAHGSPGTVYLNVNVGEEPYRMIQIDNRNRIDLPVILAESNTTVYLLERVHLIRNGIIAIRQVGKILVHCTGVQLNV